MVSKQLRKFRLRWQPVYIKFHLHSIFFFSINFIDLILSYKIVADLRTGLIHPANAQSSRWELEQV